MSVKLEDVLKDENLVKNIQEIAKDTALLHGVLMRTKETPNSSDVSHCFICIIIILIYMLHLSYSNETHTTIEVAIGSLTLHERALVVLQT